MHGDSRHRAYGIHHAADIAGFKKHLGEYLAVAAHGEETENRTRNAPPARVAPIRSAGRNRTVLGCGTGTVVVKTEPTGPMIPNDDCESL